MNARHIIRIREALWKRPERGACVMVGAGLSKQADFGSTEVRPPSWKQLAIFLQDELRCGRSDEPEPDHEVEPVTARDCPRLAQHYKATFGQSALDSLLLRRVPDGEPSLVHERLMRLPWADVFTTNWDTLLEKASKEISTRTYHPVFRSVDLATTVAPRIVKLHGSFPSYRPFVVTEEDYRTYPTRFAPLVNTVQQALMESTFLLVGFSGDDPNFLHWCGWVRDHLGAAAPRLYLAGYLDLDRPTRLALEERGVVPIDLASELTAVPSREARHRAAIEWILSSLEAGKPQERRWPAPPAQPGPISVPVMPLPMPPSDQARAEPAEPAESVVSEELADRVKEAATTWRDNRVVYPGWPILPISKHGALSRSTERWQKPVLKALPALCATDGLIVMRELLWRTELSMNLLTPELAEAATRTLSAVDEELAEKPDLSEAQRHEIDEQRVSVMLALLTDSRYDLDQIRVDQWTKRLEDAVQHGSPEFHRLQHERCLWALLAGDLAGLAERLKTWRTGDSDPMWSLRKAALLVQLGDFDDGRRLVMPVLQRAEQAWTRDRRVQTASRLGWAVYWRYMLNWSPVWDEPGPDGEAPPSEADYWARLASHDGDAQSDVDGYVRRMESERDEDSPWTFDLRRVHRITLSNAEGRSFRSAWRVIRLLELSGLPVALPGVRVTGHYLGRAGRLIAPFSPAYAARLLLFAGSGNESALDAVLSQTQLARMSEQEVSSLFRASQRMRDYFLERWTPGEEAYDLRRGQLEHSIEVMSRCVVRYGAAPAPETFRWALQYRRPRRWVDNRLWSAINRLRKHSWGAMKLESRASAVIEILCTPIPEDAVSTDSDPGELLFDALPKIERNQADEATWASCIREVSSALRGNSDARHLAFIRLNWLVQTRLLLEAEEQELARSLWGMAHRDSKSLPQVKHVEDWVYMSFPEPEPGIASERFRATWIGREIDEPAGSRTVLNVAAAWNPDHLGGHTIHLSQEEEKWFWKLVEGWLHHESGRRSLFGSPTDAAVPFLVDLLTHRRAPSSVLSRVEEAATAVPDPRLPTAVQLGSPENEYLMTAASAALGGGDSAEGEHRIRLGTRSIDVRVCLAAWNGLRWWIKRSAKGVSVPMARPSVEAVRDVGVAISTTQQSGLVGALQTAGTILEYRNPEFVEAILPFIIGGMDRLRRELTYAHTTANRHAPEELALSRHWCVWLAWLLTDAGQGDDEVVKSWIQSGDNDPLYIVRSVREWHAAAKAEQA